MKKVTYCTGTIAVAVMVFSLLLIPINTQASGLLHRLSANFSEWGPGPGEQFTSLGVPGIRVFRKTVFVPAGANVMFVTMSTTGDQHGGAAVLFRCRVQGEGACNPGGGGLSGTPPGWVKLQKTQAPSGGTLNCDDALGGGPGDCHDNGIYYQWCKRINVAGGPKTVIIDMATDSPGDTVFIEKAHWYIDVTDLTGNNRCRQAPTP